MKRWVHAATISESAKKIARARKDLNKFDPEKIEYVKECQDEIARTISDYYTGEEDAPGPKLSAIKRDYLVGAVEEDFMTEEEFEEIFDLLDTVDLELAARFS